MSKSTKKVGLYNKFEVMRRDGTSGPGEKHCGCPYFVLDLTHDKFAIYAIKAYADACHNEYPELAKDIYNAAYNMEQGLPPWDRLSTLEELKNED